MKKLNDGWVTYKGHNVGRIKIEIVDGIERKIYITERKTIFNHEGQDGFSISKGIFKKDLQPVGVWDIRVLLVDSPGSIPRGVYVVSMERWLEYGETNFYGPNDEQWFLPIEKFDKVAA